MICFVFAKKKTNICHITITSSQRVFILIRSLGYEKVSNFIKEFIFAEISELVEISHALRAYLQYITTKSIEK